jgi:hypothetical protein
LLQLESVCLFQLHGRASFGQLIECALSWRLIRPPTYEVGAVPEPVAGHMIITDLDHQLWPQRLLFGRPFHTPGAGPARGITREARWGDQLFQSLGEDWLLSLRERRRESDMMEKPVLVVEPEGERQRNRR